MSALTNFFSRIEGIDWESPTTQVFLFAGAGLALYYLMPNLFTPKTISQKELNDAGTGNTIQERKDTMKEAKKHTILGDIHYLLQNE